MTSERSLSHLLIAHFGKSRQFHASAYVAPNAIVCGDVPARKPVAGQRDDPKFAAPASLHL
jgi:hypothetical protein